jgi:hypothetical protein
MPVTLLTQQEATLHDIKFYQNIVTHKEEDLSYSIHKNVKHLTSMHTDFFFTSFNACSTARSNGHVYNNRNLLFFKLN